MLEHAPMRNITPRAMTFALAPFIAACNGVFDPRGPISRSEKMILLDATIIMLAVVVPVIGATLIFAWWFRSGNVKARRLPDWAYSGRLELLVWSVPTLVVLFLGGIAWIGSHDLDPSMPITSGLAAPIPSDSATPLDVDVVSLDWKWLFIYPAQGVASVNRLMVPSGVPLRFRLTSAGVMNSFFVPQLGSQIYTMAGMSTRLNLEADQPGTYQGLSAQFSGAGFSDMRFDVIAVPASDFSAWVETAHAHGGVLDSSGYATLAGQSANDVPHTYGKVTRGLFESIVANPGAMPRAGDQIADSAP